MAALTTAQKAALSERMFREGASVDYTKPQIFAAAQAVEDWFETNRASLNAAINAATAPLVLTAGQKRLLVIAFLLQKAGRE